MENQEKGKRKKDYFIPAFLGAVVAIVIHWAAFIFIIVTIIMDINGKDKFMKNSLSYSIGILAIMLLRFLYVKLGIV